MSTAAVIWGVGTFVGCTLGGAAMFCYLQSGMENWKGDLRDYFLKTYATPVFFLLGLFLAVSTMAIEKWDQAVENSRKAKTEQVQPNPTKNHP